jgi:hypothetical protein
LSGIALASPFENKPTSRPLSLSISLYILYIGKRIRSIKNSLKALKNNENLELVTALWADYLPSAGFPF